MPVRKDAGWMQTLDERILEHLNEESWASPRTMASKHEFRHATRRRIRERCEELTFIEFIAPIHNDMYEITTWGQLYLAGEIDAENRPLPPRVQKRSFFARSF